MSGFFFAALANMVGSDSDSRAYFFIHPECLAAVNQFLCWWCGKVTSGAVGGGQHFNRLTRLTRPTA